MRVRYHRGDLARLEVPTAEIAVRLCEPANRDPLAAELKRLGFKYVTLDLEGFRSGSQNPGALDSASCTNGACEHWAAPGHKRCPAEADDGDSKWRAIGAHLRRAQATAASAGLIR